MADKRASWAGKELPADKPRENGDVPLRLLSPEGMFPEDAEPNDESPTIISKAPAQSDALAGASDLKGRKLAHFELLEPIGVGGMAAVLRARDAQLDRIVALKILPPEMASDPENIRRFHQEARAAAKLDHENIARVFYCGEDQGLHFIAFEYVEGDNLRTILERRGTLPCGEAIRYVLQIATGLEHAASRGVVHRDIKPSNIIISPSGRAKVVDMGLARSLEPHADNGLTQSGVTLGTFDYISPEQALEPREADCRSDVYSLGCTFYHMLTGRPPVPEGTAAKKLQHHQHVAPLDPRQLNPEIPDTVARILGKMMAKNARDRYQRPIQLVQDLMQVAKASGDEFGREPLFVDVPIVAAPHRRPMLVVTSAVVALAGLLFVLSLAPERPPRKGSEAPKNSLPSAPSPIAKAAPEPAPKIVAPPSIVIRTEDDLKRAFERAGEEKTTINLDSDILLSGNLKLASLAKGKPSVEIAGPELKSGDRPAVRLQFPIDKTSADSRFGLVIEGANVTFKNIGFELVATEPVEPRFDVAAVVVRGKSSVEFETCSFVQIGLKSDIPFIQRRSQVGLPAMSLLLDTSSAKLAAQPKVTLRNCYFPKGQTAVAMVGYGNLVASDCAFHTLGALFHVKGGGVANISLEHCSAYLNNGPAFRIDDETACRLKIDYCLFSVPENAARAYNPDLVRQTDSADASKILFKGQSNGYHNLNSLWVQSAKEGAKDSSSLIAFDDLKSFRQKVELKKGGYDKDSQIIPKESPPFLNETAPPDNHTAAFELNESVAQLQLPSEKHSSIHPMLGIRKCLAFDMKRLPPLPPELSVASEYKLAPNEKVVDPDYVGDTPGYTNDLLEAMALIHAGDIITLKPGAANKEFTFRRQDLEFDLTVRGYPGTFPTVTLADTLWADANFFRLLDGKLHLENLHFIIEPKEKDVSLSLVNMVGNGTCSFKNCMITLKPKDRANPRAFPLSVVSMVAGEDAKAMMNDARPAMSTAMVKFQGCFVRGEADVLTLRGSRPVTLQVGNSLLYIGGSLVRQLQGATKEITNPDAAIAVRMKDSAFFFADPLLWLQASKAMPRYQHPLRIEQAEGCLFATLADRPLAFFETPDITDKTLSQYFDWKNHQGNAFAQFNTAYLLEQAADDGLRMLHLDAAEWKETIERESDSQFLPMGFKSLPPRPLNLAVPEDAVIRADFQAELAPFLMQLPKFPKN